MNRRICCRILHSVKNCFCYILIPCIGATILLLSGCLYKIATIAEECHSKKGYRLVECDGDEFCCATNGKVECCATTNPLHIWILNAGIVLIIMIAFMVTYCDVKTFKNLAVSMFSLITPCLWCWRRRTPHILIPVQYIELSPSNSEVNLIRMDHPSSISDAI